MIRRRLKFAAVLVAVVLALTGFSSGHGKSKGSSGSSGGGGGGGCSNSKKSNGSYGGSHADSDDYESDTDYASGDTYTSAPTATATSGNGVVAEVVTCVRKARGKRKAVTYATVRVEAPTGPTATYEVDVDFRGSSGAVLDNADTEVTLDSGESTTLRIPMETPSTLRNVTTCKATARVVS